MPFSDDARTEGRPGLDVLLTAMVTAALAAAVLYVTLAGETIAFDPAGYFALIPVSLAAYRRRGLLPGQAMAGFFSSMIAWQAGRLWLTNGPSQAALALMGAGLLLHLVAFTVSAAAESVRGRETLADTARGGTALLSRAASLNDTADFIQAEAMALTAAGAAALLLRNPVDGEWELRADGERRRLPAAGGGRISLAAWLAGRAASLWIEDLAADPRFEVGGLTLGPGPRSLLARPLAAGDGTPLAVLVLLDRRGRPFGRRDLDRLAPLLAAGGTALAQAGLLARTDRALARRAGQLAALQRAARDLNATLDAGEIASRTLACAWEIVAADAGLVAVAAAGLPPAWRAQGAALTDGRAGAIGAAASQCRRPALDPPPEVALADGRSRLVAPIRRGAEALGAVVLESRRPAAFDEQDLLAVTALADHAAAALEAARQFEQVRRERARADQIIGHMADGLLALDREGRVTALNPAAEALTGWRPIEAAGRPACLVLGCTGEDAAALAAALAGLREADPAPQGRLAVRLRTGGRRILGFSAAPLPDGGSVLLIRDVTREEELQAFQRELVATFSHELRAPLANIEALTRALLDAGCAGAESGPAEAQAPTREYVEALRSQGRRLAALAARTLDVTRLEEGAWRLEPRPLAVARLLADALGRWHTAAPDRPIRLATPDARPWASADEEAVGVVLDNLVDNALKYSPPGTEIVLAVAEGPPGFVTVSVADRGPGIPADLRERVFQRFTRGDAATSRGVSGVGLGLYVAQRLVEAMGGRIWAEDAAGGGTRFAFTLPVLKEMDDEDLDR